MAKNGFLIFDSDTHVGPMMDMLDQYLDQPTRDVLKTLEPYRRSRHTNQSAVYMIGERTYRRVLGEAEDEPFDSDRYMNRFTHSRKGRAPNPRFDYDPAARIEDMDFEGVDVNLTLPSGWFGCWTTPEGAPAELGMYQAYHRWMADYCGAFPERIFGLILVSGRDVAGSMAEVERCLKQSWPLGLLCYAPYDMPLDHPSLEPYWRIAEESKLAVVLHTFTANPPYAPGGLDTWGNMWLQRSAAHPWCGQRNMAAMIGSGIFDRYPDLNLGVLEAGHGWLPSWARRLDEQADYVATWLPPLKRKPTEYVTSGHYFQSIEMSEGEDVTRAAIQLLGEDILMYASDYPHGESWFPISVETVMGWDLPATTKRKLFWDNAVKFYRRFDPTPFTSNAQLEGAAVAGR